METQFPNNKTEEQQLLKAFELLEIEKVKSMLSANGIHRQEAKIIKLPLIERINKWWMAAAILLLITTSVVVYNNFSLESPQQLADNSISTLSSDYNFSTRNSEADVYMFEAQKSFNNEQWILAEKQLDEALLKVSTSDTLSIVNIHFYSGIVEMKQNKFKDAVLSFTRVTQFENVALYNDAIWLRGLANIKASNLDAAIVDLKFIEQLKGWRKATEASKILEAIKN